MLPLDTVDARGIFTQRQLLQDHLNVLVEAGLHGVMLDVWWGLVEPIPGQYNFQAYREAIDLVVQAGLHVQPIMSFHSCGGNVGDDVDIPLPAWVIEAMDTHNLCYMDEDQIRSHEYISLSCDNVRVLPSNNAELRTPLEAYQQFMAAFATEFKDYIDAGNIDTIHIGLGPSGELRYPSYPSAHWSYPGVGRFQASDPRFQERIQQAAEAQHHPIWGHAPSAVGPYSQRPSRSDFFKSQYRSDYGIFFLEFYGNELIRHAQDVLNLASNVFEGIQLSFKVSGVHWWHGSQCKAAELTAGYVQVGQYNWYAEAAQKLCPLAEFSFTCLEKRNRDEWSYFCKARPEQLVREVAAIVRAAGGRLAGENALEFGGFRGYRQIIRQLQDCDGAFTTVTILRLKREIIQGGNLQYLLEFLRRVAARVE